MAIKPPAWASQCVPTTQGWQDPSTGEILVSGSISNAAISEWHDARAPKTAPKTKPKTLKESPTNEEEFIDEIMDMDDEEVAKEVTKRTLW